MENLPNIIKEHLSSQKALLFLILGALLIIIPIMLIMIAGLTAPKQAINTSDTSGVAPIAPTAAAPKDPVSLLEFGTNYLDFSTELPETAGVDLVVDTLKEKAFGIEIELSYDPKILTKVNFAPAFGEDSFFGERVIITAISHDEKNGKVYFAIQVPSVEFAKQGRGKIATLSFTPVKVPGVLNTKIQYDSKSAVIKQTTDRKELLSTGRVDLDISL